MRLYLVQCFLLLFHSRVSIRIRVSGWLVVMQAYLHYFPFSLSHCHLVILCTQQSYQQIISLWRFEVWWINYTLMVKCCRGDVMFRVAAVGWKRRQLRMSWWVSASVRCCCWKTSPQSWSSPNSSPSDWWVNSGNLYEYVCSSYQQNTNSNPTAKEEDDDDEDSI